MADHQLGPRLRRPLEQLPVCRDARGDDPDLPGARDLQAVRAVVVERVRFEQLVQVAEDLLEAGDREIIQLASCPPSR
jgi:hypothetical protein